MSVSVPIGYFSLAASMLCFPIIKKHHSIRQSLHAKSILEARRPYSHGHVFIKLAICRGGHPQILQTLTRSVTTLVENKQSRFNPIKCGRIRRMEPGLKTIILHGRVVETLGWTGQRADVHIKRMHGLQVAQNTAAWTEMETDAITVFV